MDLTDGQRFLTRTYGAESLADWMRQKFGVKRPIEEIGDAFRRRPERRSSYRKMREAYRQKDLEFPVRVAMQNFMSDKPHRAAGSATTATGCSAGRRSGSARRSPSQGRRTRLLADAETGVLRRGRARPSRPRA